MLDPSLAGLITTGKPNAADAAWHASRLRATRHWGRQAQPAKDVLAVQFAHRQCRAKDTAAGIGHTEQFQVGLYHAIFTARAVQNHKHTVVILPAQRF